MNEKPIGAIVAGTTYPQSHM